MTSSINAFPPAMQKLVRELSKLPSIGHKTAIRLAYHLVNNDQALIASLSDAMLRARELIKRCTTCCFITEGEQCPICSDTRRDRSLLCVVEKPVDVVSIERSGEYRGYYHVLHGLWAPMRGQGPESMTIKQLIDRLKTSEVKEVILAMSATVEGDATALYIARIVQEVGIKSTRLAQGLPKGGELEYADELTLSHAFAGRRAVG